MSVIKKIVIQSIFIIMCFYGMAFSVKAIEREENHNPEVQSALSRYRYLTSLFYKDSGLASSSVNIGIEKATFQMMEEIECVLTLKTAPVESKISEVSFIARANNSQWSGGDIQKNIDIEIVPGKTEYRFKIPLTKQELETIKYHHNGETLYNFFMNCKGLTLSSVQILGSGNYQIVGNANVNNVHGDKESEQIVNVDPGRYNYYIAFQYARTAYSAGFSFEANDSVTGKNHFSLKFEKKEILDDPELMHQYKPYDTARVVKVPLPIKSNNPIQLKASVDSDGWGAGVIYLLRSPIELELSANIKWEEIGDNTPVIMELDIKKDQKIRSLLEIRIRRKYIMQI